MAKIFITGSVDGLGQLTAKLLIDQGHSVVLHARNAERRTDALIKVKEAENVLVGDLSSLEQTKELAVEANALGPFDAVIHNAGVYQVPSKLIFTVNTLAPFILTCAIRKPRRLIYLSSGMHLGGHAPGHLYEGHYSHQLFRFEIACTDAFDGSFPEMV